VPRLERVARDGSGTGAELNPKRRTRKGATVLDRGEFYFVEPARKGRHEVVFP
jgi:hypothetical protein